MGQGSGQRLGRCGVCDLRGHGGILARVFVGVKERGGAEPQSKTASSTVGLVALLLFEHIHDVNLQLNFEASRY